MLKNKSWDRPDDWDYLDEEGQALWNSFADNLEQFYRDMKVHKHINYGLGSYRSVIDEASYSNFLNSLAFQDKVYNSGNMLYRISTGEGGSKRLVELSQGLLDAKYYPYVYISNFIYMFILAYETSINILRKTLTTDNLKNRKGKSVDREIGPETFLDMLKKHSSDSVIHIKLIIFKHKDLRNALAHGLFWYEDKRIYWFDDVNSPSKNSMGLDDFINNVREQTIFAQCFLWVGANLLQERFYEAF